MKATGIVRRIDDLGRVVIPKEIRRTMRIREGDPLEIFTSSDGEVVFKKYSPIGELSDFASTYADVLFKGSSLQVIIIDRDVCVACAGIPKKEALERRLTVKMDEMLENRQSYISHPGDGKQMYPVEGIDRTACVAIPIIASGDVVGAVCFLTPETGAVASDSDVKLAKTAAAFLGRQMEE